ncbi:MAG: recombinase family protein [Lachnospiraceae bacterium]|nr:recombinase family protein [Lachnospiraceae bacterium]
MSGRKNVTVLMKASPITGAENNEEAKKRVAAYCRVSTDMEIQESSLTVQMESFRAEVAAHEDWELVDVYADKGASGTSADGRTEFTRMLADCRDGKIDYIITKSISRFARNTVECLSIVRELKTCGVFVYFEKEHMDTKNDASEMVLSILAAIAQEESRSISENYKWSYRKRAEAGEAKWVPLYGYKKENGEPFVPDPEKAPVVKRIFDEYYHGKSMPQIVDGLTRDGVPTTRGGKWTSAMLDRILSNEKYVGDVLCQKYYISDMLSHKQIKNNGELPSWYISGHHEPIVDRSVFEAVQEIRALKNLQTGAVQYPYGGRIICPICGEKLVKEKIITREWFSVWHCSPDKGNTVCAGYFVKEKYIDLALQQAYAELDVETLHRLADREDTKESALAALRLKETMPVLKKVEYFFLHEMVENIVFKKWDTVVVNWKCGLKSKVTVNYTKASDVPFSQNQKNLSAVRKWVKIAEEAAMAKEAEGTEETTMERGKEPADESTEDAAKTISADALQ